MVVGQDQLVPAAATAAPGASAPAPPFSAAGIKTRILALDAFRGFVMFLLLLAFTSLRVQIAAFVTILVGFWTAFVLYPLPPAGFDYTQVGVRPDWPHLYEGFRAHFNKNSNLSWAFDVWFLNLFPRVKP